MKRLAAGSEATPSDVARQIKQLRQQRKFSQQALAEASSLSRNTLSLIERGQTSPTLDTLQKIADALQVDISAFFPGGSRPEPTHNKADAHQRGPASKLASDQGTHRIDGLISTLILQLEPEARCGSLLPHSGEEFIYCLSGRCLLSVDRQSYMLEPGDSLHFDGRLPHTCQNPGQETAKALVIFLDLEQS